MLVALAFFALIQASHTLRMHQVTGSISDVSGCSRKGGLEFDDCERECSRDDKCMIAYMEDNSDSCYLCSYGRVSRILSDDDDSSVSVKVDSDSDSTSCEEPQDGATLFGYVLANNGDKLKYKLRYSQGSWKISYFDSNNGNGGNGENGGTGGNAPAPPPPAPPPPPPPPPPPKKKPPTPPKKKPPPPPKKKHGCPVGWRRFNRKRGPWCIGTFYSASGKLYNWFEAQRQCQRYGAVLTGIENDAERKYIKNSIMPKWKPTLGMVWLGGKRNPACVKPRWDANICKNKHLVYQWTDGFTVGTQGFNFWQAKQPDGLVSTATHEQQQCVVMNMAHKQFAPLVGQLDDEFCSMRNDKWNLRGQAYACGKQP